MVLATIVKKVHIDEASSADQSPRCAVKDPLPPGVAKLVQKGYSLNSRFDPRKHKKGIFKGVVPINAEFSEAYHLIGVDQGQINISTTVRREAQLSRATRRTVSSALKSADAEKGSTCFTTD